MPKKSKKSPSLPPGVCALCGVVTDDDYLGQLFVTPQITAHENCLLFSPLLLQILPPDVTKEGYLIGFKINDIEREVKRIMRLRCKICHEKRAGVGCCNTSCPRSFHLCCGLKSGAMGIFKDCFQFYCSEHSPSQELKSQISLCKNVVPECTICLSSLIDEGYSESADINKSVTKNQWSHFKEKIKEKSILHGKCCTRCWVHRSCMRQYGLSAGLHHTKCPNCGDNNKFIEIMLQNGIWLPDRDASWELEPGAFQELYQNDNDVATEEILYEPTAEVITESVEECIDLTNSDDEYAHQKITFDLVTKVKPEDDYSHIQRLPRQCTTKIKPKEVVKTSQILPRKRKRPLEWSSLSSPTKPIKRKRDSNNIEREGVLVKKSCSKCSKTIVTLSCKAAPKNDNVSLLKDSNRKDAASDSALDYTCISCSL